MLYRFAVATVVASLAGHAAALQLGSRVPVMSMRRGAVSMQVAAPTKGSQVESLLQANSALIADLASVAPDMPELSRLRFALAFPEAEEAKGALKEAMDWRTGEGKSIVDSAAEAFAKATAGGGWDNEVVRDAAPHAAVINPYITSKNIITLSTDDGDLVYVIRASLIEDKEMMTQVTVEQFTDFLLYVKEIHSLVVNARSEKSGRLCNVIFANDITGTRKAPDPLFSKALTSSSKGYEKLYPSMAGPTMILNLPFILQAFVGFFKPLFPKVVQERLRFDKAPYLSKLGELTPLTTDASARQAFLKEVMDLLGPSYNGVMSK
jgi:hypothetical protein